MVTYPIRLNEELYRKLRERAKKEGHSLAVLLRESAAAAAGNPSIGDQLAAIREDIAKFGCSSEMNRAVLLATIEKLSHNDFDRKGVEDELRVYDAMLRGVKYHDIKKIDELREFVREALKAESENK